MNALFQKIFKKEDTVDVEKLRDQAELSFIRSRFDRDLYLALAESNNDTVQYCDFLRGCLAVESNELVSLDDELKRLSSYITSFQLSRKEVIYCKYECNLTKDERLALYPFVLLPLVKNALYYGYNIMESHPMRIRLSMVGEKLKVEVSNKVNHHVDSQEQNDIIRLLKSRLDFLYGDDYELLFNSNSNLFKATLLIDLVR